MRVVFSIAKRSKLLSAFKTIDINSLTFDKVYIFTSNLELGKGVAGWWYDELMKDCDLSAEERALLFMARHRDYVYFCRLLKTSVLAQASNAVAERWFSVSKDLVSGKRTMTSPTVLNDLMFLKEHLRGKQFTKEMVKKVQDALGLKE